MYSGRRLPAAAALLILSALLVSLVQPAARAGQYWEAVVPPDQGAVALSGLDYDPVSGLFWSVRDSGTGTTDWLLYLYQIAVDSDGTARVEQAIPLFWPDGRLANGAELDPEGIALAPDGTSIWLCDEYGPWLVEVSLSGAILQVVEPPERYLSRRNGRGFEGIGVSPDGTKVFTILQYGLSDEPDPKNTWLLVYDTLTGQFAEYRYQLDDPAAYDYPDGTNAWIGANGIQVLDADDLLIIERDNLTPPEARVKRVYRAHVPEIYLGDPLPKQLEADLLALGNYPYEKLEGIAMMKPEYQVVINDNDGDPNNTTALWFYTP